MEIDSLKNPQAEHFEEIYPEARFGGYSHYNGTLRFYERIHALLLTFDKPTVLNLGCGRGVHAALFEGITSERSNL